MRVLVVGASGFVGKNLLRCLPSQWEVVGTYNSDAKFVNFIEECGLNVKPVKMELRDGVSAKEKLSELGWFDACVYLASDSRVGLFMHDPLLDVEGNIAPLVNFLQGFKGGKMLFFSSGAVYTGLSGRVSPKSGLQPNIPFAISRAACEQYVKFFTRSLKSIEHYIVIRFFGAYGRYEHPRKLTAKLLAALTGPDANPTFTIFGDGDNFVDLMYVEDACDAVVRILQSERVDVTVDLCGGSHMTLNEYVSTVGKILGREIRVIHEGQSPEYIRFYASTQGMRNLFGFTPRIAVKEGISKYLKLLATKM